MSEAEHNDHKRHSIVSDISRQDPTFIGCDEKAASEHFESLTTSQAGELNYLRFGRYAVLICIVTELAMLTLASNTMYMVYAGVETHVASCGNYTFATQEEYCHNRKICAHEQLLPQREFVAVNDEWSLHCEDSLLVKTSTSVQIVAQVLGAAIFGQLSDNLGRRKPLMFCLFIICISGLGVPFAPNLFIFTVVRCITGFFNGGLLTISVVYLMENVPAESRMILNCFINWSPNVVLLAVMAYVAASWSTLSVFISMVTVPAIVLLFFCVESPRILIQKRRFDDAKSAILRIVQIDGNGNNIKEDDVIEYMNHLKHKQDCQAQGHKNKKYTVVDLFSRKHLAIGTLAIAFSQFSSQAINYSNMFNLGSLSGSLYINNAIIGSIRYVFGIATGVVDLYCPTFGRRMSHGLCGCINAVCLTTSLLIALFGDSQSALLANINRVCVIVVCTSASQIYNINGVTCSEFVPTVVRSSAMSVIMLSSTMATATSPYVFYMGNAVHSLPYIYVLVLGVADLVLFHVLVPETKGMPLRDHLDDKQPASKNQVHSA